MKLGGPVWHASVAAVSGYPIPATLEREALRQLTGVGDQNAGEWREWSGRAFHIRRRLTAAEEERTGPVADIRRTPEARARASMLGSWLRLAPAGVLADELGDGHE